MATALQPMEPGFRRSMLVVTTLFLAVMAAQDSRVTGLLRPVAALGTDEGTPLAVAAVRAVACLGRALAETSGRGRAIDPALLDPVADVLPALRRALESERPAVATEAAEALAALKDRDSAEAMIRLLEAPSLAEERYRLFRALRTLTGQRLPNEPHLWGAWWKENRQAFLQRELH